MPWHLWDKIASKSSLANGLKSHIWHNNTYLRPCRLHELVHLSVPKNEKKKFFHFKKLSTNQSAALLTITTPPLLSRYPGTAKGNPPGEFLLREVCGRFCTITLFSPTHASLFSGPRALFSLSFRVLFFFGIYALCFCSIRFFERPAVQAKITQYARIGFIRWTSSPLVFFRVIRGRASGGGRVLSLSPSVKFLVFLFLFCVCL